MSSKLKSSTTISIFSLILLLLCIPSSQATDGPQTITKADGYGRQRPCAAFCFESYDGPCLVDRIGAALGCDYPGCSPVLESCYCRPDLQSIAYSFLSDCITSSCIPAGAVTLDLQSASNIYSGYCSAAGYTSMLPPPTSTTKSTSPSPSSSTSATPSSTPVDPHNSPTATSGSVIFSTVPPDTTTQVLTTQMPVTITKVLVSPTSVTSMASPLTAHLRAMLLLVRAGQNKWRSFTN